jgi:DNA-directed RNA polymerase subunit H (RpoH/RPB5)
MSTSNRILSIYKSRNTILEHMETLGYDISEYKTFSINEVDAMLSNDQLDMLVENKTTNRKVYIKYYFSAKTGSSGQLRGPKLDLIVEDLIDIEGVLTKNDSIVIIIDEEPNDGIIAKMRYLYDNQKIFVVIHNIKRLQFNILQHELNPKEITILSDAEVEELKVKLNIKSVMQLPETSRFDPLCLAIMLRPGQVVKYIRTSSTALEAPYYSICV